MKRRRSDEVISLGGVARGGRSSSARLLFTWPRCGGEEVLEEVLEEVEPPLNVRTLRGNIPSEPRVRALLIGRALTSGNHDSEVRTPAVGGGVALEGSKTRLSEDECFLLQHSAH
ncbi:hypothetical protein EYF80_046326 [Liparis tanakae]|uniref:Uncharacterized protein n=1 Tax=Liparis tanakae TaxID=230148 RepID=A0A4Z2FQQ2_9TELE|nr:hypothetical protein EYF80_046326 [Liparis tanakae]